MHALIVVSHPLDTSLTHGVAAAIAEGITAAEPANTFEIADLTQEGFDPVYGATDIAAFLKTASIPADILAEQKRIDSADALVLVFPIYWWSMPALLKGWVDRVFLMVGLMKRRQRGQWSKNWGIYRCIWLLLGRQARAFMTVTALPMPLTRR